MQDGCVCEQSALEGFLSDSPGQKTHESAASRIYSQLIKLAFVLRLGEAACQYKHTLNKA